MSGPGLDLDLKTARLRLAPFHEDEAEASRALLRYAFEELGFAEVRASTDTANQASLRVLEKLGMRLERTATVQGLETVFFSLRQGDWAPPYTGA